MVVSTNAPTFAQGQLEVLAGLEDEGGDLIPQIVNMFVADTDRSLAKATDAVSHDNLSTLRWIVHDLIGSCGTIGAGRMRALAGEIELTLARGQLQAVDASVRMLVEEYGRVRALLGEYASSHAHPLS